MGPRGKTGRGLPHSPPPQAVNSPRTPARSSLGVFLTRWPLAMKRSGWGETGTRVPSGVDTTPGGGLLARTSGLPSSTGRAASCRGGRALRHSSFSRSRGARCGRFWSVGFALQECRAAGRSTGCATWKGWASAHLADSHGASWRMQCPCVTSGSALARVRGQGLWIHLLASSVSGKSLSVPPCYTRCPRAGCRLQPLRAAGLQQLPGAPRRTPAFRLGVVGEVAGDARRAELHLEALSAPPGVGVGRPLQGGWDEKAGQRHAGGSVAQHGWDMAGEGTRRQVVS